MPNKRNEMNEVACRTEEAAVTTDAAKAKGMTNFALRQAQGRLANLWQSSFNKYLQLNKKNIY